MSINTSTFFKEETILCCYPTGTSLTLATSLQRKKFHMALWTLGTVCVIIAFTHFANILNHMGADVASRMFLVVFNKAIKFDDCPPGSYMYCPSNMKCISFSQRCDFFQDCPDDRDESNCECLAREFACHNGRCLSEMFLCDGFADCPEGDDEEDYRCPKCIQDEFRCKGIVGHCIPWVNVCDGIKHCEKGEDEDNCVFLNKNKELIVRTLKMTEASVCYFGWNKTFEPYFCKKASKGPPIKSFPLVQKGFTQIVELQVLSNKAFKFIHNKSCFQNKIVALLCEHEACGRRKIPEEYFKPYIINGIEATRGEFPWQVWLKCGSSTCGGSIIDDRWILTAAHCVYDKPQRRILNPNEIYVYAGSTHLMDNNWVLRSVIKVIIHYQYLKSTFKDVALLKLSRSMPYSPYIQPICLPYEPFVESDYLYCISTGFGRTYRDEGSPVLLKLRMKKKKTKNIKIENIIAIGTESGNKYPNACMGDSGGPFSCRSKMDDKWTVFGVNSFVSYDKKIIINHSKKSSFCQDTYIQLVYNFLPWIEEIIEENKD